MLALAFSPSTAAVRQVQAKRHAVRPLALFGADLLGTFTPAAADPRIAAALSRGTLSDGAFRFTPSTTPGGRRAVTVAVRARATTPAEAQRTVAIASAAPSTPTSVTPSAYNLGVAVGWQHFGLSGAVARVDTGILPGGRESADVAVSYGGPKWNTRLQIGADRPANTEAPRLLTSDGGVSVDLGGSYSLTRNIAVTGGVRYRIDRDRIAADSTVDDRRDSQAVYVGTAFRF